LSGLKLLAVMIDGVYFAEHMVLAAIGLDLHGKKHVLGLREGATENVAACKELLADLIERGLPTDRALLFIIDGLVRNFVFLSQLVNERSSRGQRLRIGHLNRSDGRSQGWPEPVREANGPLTAHRRGGYSQWR